MADFNHKILPEVNKQDDISFYEHIFSDILSLAKRIEKFKSKNSIENFSEREIEIIRLLSKGYSTKEIAGQLNRSFHTVESHRATILRKSGCKNALELGAFAVKTGLV